MKKVEKCTYRNVLNYNKTSSKPTPNQMYRNLQLNQKKIVNEQRRAEQGYNSYINQKYSDLFEKMEVFLFVASNYNISVFNYYYTLSNEAKIENNDKMKSLQLILISVLEKYNEIIYLLKGGFLYGSMSGLRAIFELTVVAYIISSSSNDTAIEYLKSFDDRNNYYNWAKKSELVKERLENNTNYNKSKDISFSLLKKIFEANITGTFKESYKFCSEQIHMSPKKVIKRYQSEDDLINVSFGIVKDGLETPVKIATLLVLITCSFLSFGEDDRKIKEMLYILDKECTDIIEKCDVLNSIYMDKN